MSDRDENESHLVSVTQKKNKNKNRAATSSLQVTYAVGSQRKAENKTEYIV